MDVSDCLFCKVAAGEIPSQKLFEDDEIVAFEDINPHAPVHVLVIPRRHITTLNELEPGDDPLMGRLLRAGARVARERDIADRGYRVVLNCNADAGQSVWHVHMHVLGGRNLRWPPG